jgi:Uma2 family endonuclease
MELKTQLHTIAEFEAFIALPENRDRKWELINGEYVEKMPTQVHGRLAGTFQGELYIYFKQNKLGFAEIEVRHQLPNDPHNARLPDVSVTLDTRTPPVAQGAVMKMPDIAIEIKSPDDTYTQMRATATYYIANGSKMVWLVFPEKRLIEVYRSGFDVDILDINDMLTGYDLLPGFELPLKDIFTAMPTD